MQIWPPAAEPEFRTRSWFGPRLVGAVPPHYGQEAYDSVMSALGGQRYRSLPEILRPLRASNRNAACAQPATGRDTDKIRARRERGANIFLRRTVHEPADYRGLPLQGRGRGLHDGGIGQRPDSL